MKGKITKKTFNDQQVRLSQHTATIVPVLIVLVVALVL